MKIKFKFSLERYTTFIVFSFIILLGIMVTTALTFKINKEIWNAQQLNFHREDEIRKNELITYLDTRKIALKDYTEFSIVKQTVMQPSANTANISDFLKELKILNERNQISLLDFEGNVISSNSLFETFKYDSKWFESIINSDVDDYTQLIEYQSKYYWRIAVPILYNQLPEGVLVMEFPFENILSDEKYELYKGIKEIYYYKDIAIHEIGSSNNKNLREILFDNLDFSIKISVDNTDINKGIRELLTEIIIIISVLSLVSVIGLLFLLRKFIIKPIKKLTESTILIETGDYKNKIEIDSHIVEINNLIENFNKMIKVIEKREISLKKRKQKALKKNTLLHCTLEQLKATQSQLLQQEKLASIGQLAAGVAHELNNPLGFVNSNFTVLKDYMSVMNRYIKLSEEIIDKHLKHNKDDIVDFKTANDLEFIFEDLNAIFEESEEGIERAIHIVKNLKDFSRIDSERKSNFDFNQGIESTLSVAKNEYQYVADINKDLGELPIIEANGSEINQVVLNLIVNAAQAIKGMKLNQKRSISVRTYTEDEYVYCEVEDTGPGMNEVIVKKVFDPFFTTKPIGQGTGLGLNISYNIIVKKHKGDFTVESEVGKGTKFTIKLPIRAKKEKSNSKE